ncbi:MAG: hypothetical protein IPJ06_02960 [Saprospiraceae bacterium]|nr:hypothetical protein [Saprospiraceae bacterium]
MIQPTRLFFCFFLIHFAALTAQTDQVIPVQGICIYIDYPDAPMNVTAAELDGMLNDPDYQAPGSAVRSEIIGCRRLAATTISNMIFSLYCPQLRPPLRGVARYEGIKLWQEALEWHYTNSPQYDWDALSQWSSSDPYNKDRPGYFDGAFKSVMVVSSVYGPAGVGAAHYPGWVLSNGKLVGSIQGSVIQAPWHPTRNLFVLFP